jgi:hypothetical protein
VTNSVSHNTPTRPDPTRPDPTPPSSSEEGAVPPPPPVAHTREAGNRTHPHEDERLKRTTNTLNTAWQTCGQRGPQPKHTDILDRARKHDPSHLLGHAEILAADVHDRPTSITNSLMGVFDSRLDEQAGTP